MKPMTFEEFAAIVSELNEEPRPTIPEGIANTGPAYSAAKDSEIDSLDLVEMTMELEEGLLGHFGKDFTIPDEMAEEAEDMGKLYTLICESVGIEPVMNWKKVV